MQTHIRRLTPLVLILFVAFGLRMFRLGDQPLWSDEIYSVAVARHSVSGVAGWVYRDNHPALYWFVLYPIVHLLGDGELLVRFPSALIGTLTVALTYAAGREILNSRRVGVFAALWLTVSPIHVVYSQEARMYALLAMFGIASGLLLHRGAFRGGAFNWALFGATAAATAHSHNYGLLLVAAYGLWALGLVLWKRESRLVWGSTLGLSVFALLYGPMIPALMTQMQMSVGSTGVATLRDVVDLLEAFGAGFTGFSTPGLTPGWLISRTAVPSVVVTATLVLLGLLSGVTDRARGDIAPKREKGWSSLLLGICLSFPVVFVYGYSALAHKALWQVRGFQMALGCVALLVGAGLEALRTPLLRGTVCFSLIALAAVNLYPHYFHRYKSTVPDAVNAMERELGPKDILFVAPYWDWTPFRYYYRGPTDAVGGRKEGDTFDLAGVGMDYADLIDPRSLEIQSKVRKPVVLPSQLRPDDYARVWTISHRATPQRVIEVFGNDVAVMHYDIETREWRTVVYPIGTPLSDLGPSVKVSSLRWNNGLRLVGYKWRKPTVVGEKACLTLFWISEQPQVHPLELRLRLIDSEGEAAFEQHSSMLSLMHSLPMTALGIKSAFPTTAWPAGNIVAQDVMFETPPELPPLSYRLNLRIADRITQRVVSIGGESEGTLGRVSVSRPPKPYRPQDVAVQRRLNISFGGRMKLFGYDLPQDPPRPGHHLPVWLHWAAETSPSTDYQVQLRLLSGDGAHLAETMDSPSRTAFPTSMWKDGDLTQSRLDLHLPPDMEGGKYRLAVRVFDSRTGQPLLVKRAFGLRSREWIAIGMAKILSWPLLTEAPVMENETDAQFGEVVRLLGYDLKGYPVPGEKLGLTLYWRARTSPDKSYSVFVHLTDQAGKLVTQADGIPAKWLRPTTTWREGEVIADEHTLSLPSDLSAGRYRLYVGFYELEGQRLPVHSRGQLVPGARLPLQDIQVKANE